MIDEERIGKHFYGSGCGVTEEISQDLRRGPEEIQGKPHSKMLMSETGLESSTSGINIYSFIARQPLWYTILLNSFVHPFPRISVRCRLRQNLTVSSALNSKF